MNIKTYYTNVLVLRKIIGLTLIILGIFLLFLKLVIFIFLGIIAICLSFTFILSNGIEVNVREKKIREFSLFFGIKIGKWRHFKDPIYISVFTSKWKDEEGSSHEFLEVNLFYKNNQYLTVYNPINIKEAFEVANFLKSILNLDILDATKNQQKWI